MKLVPRLIDVTLLPSVQTSCSSRDKASFEAQPRADANIKMKLFLPIFVACVAVAAAAPREKRIVLGDFAAEAAKILVCEGKGTEEACEACCHSTDWLFSVEESGCVTACQILPNAADYLTTYKPANLINGDAQRLAWSVRDWELGNLGISANVRLRTIASYNILIWCSSLILHRLVSKDVKRWLGLFDST
ncbi:hypothetical protein RRG08_038939 [Elysia crispata]|uniref:Uncharacterized protein n=1 Tax=Elysia crispata TaxID=231223 RepID=A0AAE0Y8G4_9GAST|nr:hypothetical protein RRG08_038939 [Elysia crispata]